MKKRISIIVPCYNVVEYIPQCMKYLLNQTIGLENMEIILIDDASTDNGATLSMLYNYREKYPNSVIVVASAENRKQGGARNLGLQYATGEYTAYCDADDWYALEAMEKLYTIAKIYNCDTVEFNNQYMKSWDDSLDPIRKPGEEDKIWIIESEEDRKKYLLDQEVSEGCWERIYRTSMLKDNDIRYVEGVVWEEPSFTYITRFYVKKHYHLNEILHYAYVREGSTMHSSYEPKKFDNLITYETLLKDIVRRGFFEPYRQEIEYIFWYGYFYSSLCFAAAYAETFYPKNIFIEMQEKVRKVVPDIRFNPYFKAAFPMLPALGDLTYCNAENLDEQEIYEIFKEIAEVVCE